MWSNTRPHDVLSHPSHDKQADSAPDSPSLLYQLVKKHQHYPSDQELNEDDHTYPWISNCLPENPSDYVCRSLKRNEDYGKNLASSSKESPICRISKVDAHHSRSGEKLHYQTRSYDGTDPQFHQGTSARCKNYPKVAEGVFPAQPNAVERHLTHDEVECKCQSGPEKLFVKPYPALRRLNLKHEP